ncbi:MAG: 50S ribosomal protein L3 N(5)-glutamine methyltransferase [Burkholderiales bacterium]
MFAEARSSLRTVRDLLRFAVSRFTETGLSFGHGSHSAYDEAAYLILHTLHLPLERLEPFLDAALTPAEIEAVLNIVQRRTEQRIPAAYLTREAWLGDFRFYVDERVIVPRSHIAGLLSDGLAPWVRDPQAVRHALDLCTGSGCLAILLAHTFDNASINASDLCADALAVAEKNITDYRLQDRIRLHTADLFSGLPATRFQVIVCNPPYVDRQSMAALPAEYRAEPPMALDGGDDGLEVVRRIIDEAPRHLSADGVLVVEIGNHRIALERAYPKMPFTWLETATGGTFVFLLTAADLGNL